MSLKAFIRSYTPKFIVGLYHYLLALLAALVYGFPARKLVVVGVTGTKGKSTTSAMIQHVLSTVGYKTGLLSTAQFIVGERRWLNDLKMTMPSPFMLQRLLRDVVNADCSHVVVETSSEGLAQSRHIGIPYQVAVFTNLAPEHIEAHGSFENYRAAKAKLFQACAARGGRAVINMDDAAGEYYAKYNKPSLTTSYSLKENSLPGAQALRATIVSESARNANFIVNNISVTLPVGGRFNEYNALAALGAAESLGVELSTAAQALASFPGTPGRLEYISTNHPFDVVVDYAHTPESLEALYQTLTAQSKLIAVLGSCGGGRDKAKRPALGKLAGQYARMVVVTDEDPYDEDPQAIMESVAVGARAVGKQDGVDLFIEPDRRLAIRKVLQLVQPGEVVAITGKGSEQWMCVASGKVPWDDRNIVSEELLKI